MSNENAALQTANKSRMIPIETMDQFSQFARHLAKANFLGTKSEGEAAMVLGACQQRGEDLLTFQQRYHLRQGRFSMTAHAMLDEFVSRGGSYKIVERSSDRSCIRFRKGENSYKSELTWEDAQEEPFVYSGGEKEQLANLALPAGKRKDKLKVKYRTPRSRMQMLWARAVSDGVAVVDPGARMAYTTEEVDDIVDSQGPVVREEFVVDPADITIVAPEGGDEAPASLKLVDGCNDAGATEKAAEGDSEADFPAPPVADADSDVDYTVIPFGEKAGVKWSELPTKHLESALKIMDARMTPDHKGFIQSVIDGRNVAK
mgnify:FL=1